MMTAYATAGGIVLVVLIVAFLDWLARRRDRESRRPVQ